MVTSLVGVLGVGAGPRASAGDPPPPPPPPPDFGAGAQALAAAERGERVPTRPIPPPPPPACARVAVIGDSLTVGSRSALRSGLAEAGFDAVVDAYGGRRIGRSAPDPYSGVKAALEVRATFGEADCWVIALGTNDLYAGAGDPRVARALVDEMLSVVTPGADVWWVNINFHDNPNNFGAPVDEEAGTAVFNAGLDARADGDGTFTVIDWYAYSEDHLWWFVDWVHVNSAGYLARARQTIDALPR